MANTVSIKHDVTNETVADASQDGDIMDNEMSEASPTTNKGTTPELLMGKTNCSGKSCDQRRPLHFLDMAQVVPKDAIITAAELWLWVTGYAILMPGDVTAQFHADRLRRQDWVESEATHNNYKSGSAWTTAGAESTLTDRDSTVRNELTGLDPGYQGSADAQVIVGATTLQDTRGPDFGMGSDFGHFVVSCDNKNLTVTSVSGDTITGSGGWSPSQPASGLSYTTVHGVPHGWWSPSILNIVQDAQKNQGGKVHFRIARLDTTIKTAWITYMGKEAANADQYPHLRVTYEMGIPTDSGADINEGAIFAAGDTTLTVDDGTKFAVGQFIRLENRDDDGYELLKITGISTNDLTVTRGEGGTSDAQHDDGIDVYLWDFSTFQAIIK